MKFIFECHLIQYLDGNKLIDAFELREHIEWRIEQENEEVFATNVLL